MFKSAFKKAAAVAVLLSPFVLFAGQAQAASPRVPNDPRYKTLSETFKTAQNDCVLLDRINETQNRKSDEIRKIIENVQRIPEGRLMLDRARDNGVAFCMVPPDASPDIYNDLYAFYNPGSMTVVFNQNTPTEGNVSYALHELRHSQQDFDGEISDYDDLQLAFSEQNARILKTETEAFVTQIIDTWMMARDEYTNGKPYSAARRFITQEDQYVALMNSGDVPAARAIKDNNIFYQAFEKLDQIYKQDPAAIENGRAAEEVRDLLNKQGIIREIYTNTGVKQRIHIMIYNLTKAAQQNPQVFDDQRQDLAIWLARYMVKQGIVSRMEDAIPAALDLVDAAADRKIVERAAKNPEQVADGGLGLTLYEELVKKGVIDEISHDIMNARKSESQQPRFRPTPALIPGFPRNV